MRLSPAIVAIFCSLFSWTSVFGAQPPRLDAVGDPLPPQALHRFGTARFCTQAEVVSLALAQDGKLLAAADREGRVYLWDVATGKQLLRTRTDTGKRVALSPDGQWLASGEEFPFELRKISQIDQPLLPIGNGPRVFVFTPDSKAIAMTMTGETDVVLLDLQTGNELRRFAGLDGAIAAIAFSPDGKHLAAAAPATDEEKPEIRIAVWDALKGNQPKEVSYPSKQVQKLVFLPDNKTLVGQFSSRLAAWDITTGEPIPKIAHNVGSSFAFDAAGKVLASTDGPKVIEFPAGKELHDFDSPALLRHLALSGDGKLLVASPTRFESASPRLLMWDLTAGKERTVPEEHRHFVDAVAFAQDGLKIATASNVEGVARVWDAKSAKLLNVLNLDRLAAKQSGGPRSRSTLIDGLAFSPSAPELFVAGQRWNLKTSEPVELEADDDFRFEQTNSRRAVLAPDGRLAASFLNGSAILFWDPAKAKAIQKIEPKDKNTRGMWTGLVFSPNGKFAATGKLIPRPAMTEDDVPFEPSVYLWEIATGKLVKKLRAAPGLVARLMFAPDGETLAVISLPTKLEFWHLPTGRLLREMPLTDVEELPRVFSLPTVAFASHGQWLAFTHQESEIVLLETLTGKEIRKLRGHQGYISSLAFSPDNRRMLTGGRDTTALLWSILPENPELPAVWKDADALWQQLGHSPDQAYRVVWALMSQPQRAVEVVSKRLQPDSGATDKEIRALIKNLSSAKFDKRDQAITRLKQIGTRSFPALEEAFKNAPDLETTRRIQQLLRTVETALTPETLRDLRSLQILEMIATPEARTVLTDIARGDGGAAKTRLAQAALERLKTNQP